MKVIFILLIFHSNFHFIDVFFSKSFCCKLRRCAIFGAERTSSYFLRLHTNKDTSPLRILNTRQGREAPSMNQLKRLDTRHNRHWLKQGKRIQSRVCSAKNKETRMKFKCRDCNKELCATPCFKVYHIKLHF